MPTVRFGGGVWKHQEDVRADLQRRLDETNAQLHNATVEVDRVHAQCVRLLRDKNELTASLHEIEMQRRHQADELHAAKQNVAELMALLTKANEAHARLEKDHSTVTKRWHHARDQGEQFRRDAEELRAQNEESEHETRRLRDLLYAVQEESECQQQEIARQQKRLAVVVHSNEAKDRQILTLVRERDGFAQKLAQCRSRFTAVTVSKLPVPTPQLRSTCEAPHLIDESCDNAITWTEISPVEKTAPIAHDSNVVAFEQQKQRLRQVALLTKARLDKERAQNAKLLNRIDVLERSHQELLVRYRGAAAKVRPKGPVAPWIQQLVEQSVRRDHARATEKGPIQAA
jgi:hypothetical protein